jgi:hypothetical protein
VGEFKMAPSRNPGLFCLICFAHVFLFWSTFNLLVANVLKQLHTATYVLQNIKVCNFLVE